MHVWVDADACPVISIVERISNAHDVAVTLLCDTNHVLHSQSSEVRVSGAGRDATDFALINACQRGDLVVTQDYGLAAMALGKGAYAIHQSGSRFTHDNIDQLLMERHLAAKIRRSSGKHHFKGPSKRTHEDDRRFSEAFEQLLREALLGKTE